MSTKYKVLVILFASIILVSFSVVTYSYFRSQSTLDSSKTLAKFIFNAEGLNQFQLALSDLHPGDEEEYLFSVSNNYFGNVSNVSVEYGITVKTYHLLPIIIELYKLNGEAEELLMTCDETYERNSQNELVCAAPIQEMVHSSETLDNYKLKVRFLSEYNDPVYSDLIDYIDVEIKGWQVIGE